MNRIVAILALSLVLAVPATLLAQHHHHDATPAAQPKPAAPATQATQSAAMNHMADMEKLQGLLEASSVALDRAAEADDPAARRQYLEESRAKLAEFKAAYGQHHQQMTGDMKSCPMMQQKGAAASAPQDHSSHP